MKLIHILLTLMMYCNFIVADPPAADTSYFYGSGNDLKPCFPGCKTCTDKNIADCTAYDDGYGIDTTTNNAVIKCLRGCQKCGEDFEKCDYGENNYGFGFNTAYYLNNDIPLKCYDNCGYCTGTDDENCTKAAYGWYKDDSHNFGECKKNCKICSNKTDCSKAVSGYYIESDEIKKCADGCGDCTGGEMSSCTAAAEGFYLTTGENGEKKVEKCMDNCRKCNKDKKCQIAGPGYYRTESLGLEKCKKNCQICSGGDENDCQVTYSGYFIRIEGEGENKKRKIERCIPNCMSCTNSSLQECFEVAPRHYKNHEENRIDRCAEHCEECTGPTMKECTKLEDGYFYDENKNVGQCVKNCEKCNGPNFEQCTEIKKGCYIDTYYKLIKRCDPACKSCSGFGPDKCTECAENHEKSKSGGCRKITEWDTTLDLTLESFSTIITSTIVLISAFFY